MLLKKCVFYTCVKLSYQRTDLIQEDHNSQFGLISLKGNSQLIVSLILPSLNLIENYLSSQLQTLKTDTQTN